jgi:glycosyltransferase involved in cell wall biosynthesis
MRFCMVTTFYPPYNFGGDGIFVRELAQALAQLGHEVRVIHCEDAFRLTSNAPAPDLPQQYDDNGVEVCRLKSTFGALSPLLTQQLGRPGLKAKQLAGLLDDGFDVINFHNISLVGGPAVLAFGQAPAKLYTLHEHWLVCATHIFWKNGVKRCDSRQCLRCCVRSGIPPQLWRYTGQMQRDLGEIDVLIAPSQFTAEQHLRFFPDVPTRILPLFSRIQPPRCKPRDRRSGERPMFVYSGRITASKGVESILEQFARMTDYDLVLAGDGDALAGLRERFAGCANIKFTGRIDKGALVALYASALALVFPSLAPETFGLTAVEAMACGTPAIVMDAGGCGEIIETTGAGFVYRQADELPGLLHRLVADPELQQHLSQLAESGYRKYYTRQRYLDDYLALVSEIRERKSPGRQAGGDLVNRSPQAVKGPAW